MYLCYRILAKNIILNKNALTLRNYQAVSNSIAMPSKKSSKPW